jgi:hypothetical protein
METLDISEYKFNLPEKYRVIAENELREDDNRRKQALEQFKEWIIKHPNIKRCPHDAVFLLRFLRAKKFSVQQACELLETGLILRQLQPTLYCNLDIMNPKMSALLDTGYLTPLKERDEYGRRIVIARVSSVDPNKFTAYDIMRLNILFFGYLLGEEESQIAGFVYIIDNSNITLKHASIFSFMDIKTWTHMVQHATPCRMKEIHMINLPSYTTTILEFFLKLLSKKLKDRVHIHSSVENIDFKLDRKHLPKEYGGEVSIAKMNKEFKKKLIDVRKEFLAIDDLLEINVTKRPEWSCDVGSDMGISGSFRKLEID